MLRSVQNTVPRDKVEGHAHWPPSPDLCVVSRRFAVKTGISRNMGGWLHHIPHAWHVGGTELMYSVAPSDQVVPLFPHAGTLRTPALSFKSHCMVSPESAELQWLSTSTTSTYLSICLMHKVCLHMSLLIQFL